MNYLAAMDRRVEHAKTLHPRAYNSHHEGLAVLMEEVHELQLEVYQADPDNTRLVYELVDIGAVCARWAEELCGVMDYLPGLGMRVDNARLLRPESFHSNHEGLGFIGQYVHTLSQAVYEKRQDAVSIVNALLNITVACMRWTEENAAPAAMRQANIREGKATILRRAQQ